MTTGHLDSFNGAAGAFNIHDHKEGHIILFQGRVCECEWFRETLCFGLVATPTAPWPGFDVVVTTNFNQALEID